MSGTGAGRVIAADFDRMLSGSAVPWADLRDARVFVTGGTGFIGRWLLGALVAADSRFGLGCTLTVLSRDPAGFRERSPALAGARPVRLVAGDVRDFPLPSERFTHVIHAATEASPVLDRGDPATMYDVCTTGTARALDLARASGQPRFLFVSSGAVYGPPPAGAIRLPESAWPAADAPDVEGAYARGKRAAETLCRGAAAAGLPAAVARVFALVGPGLPLDTHFAIGNFIRDALAGGPIVVHGDGTSVRSYLYAADVAEWLLAILLRSAPGACYNVGGEEAIPIAALAGRVALVAAARGRSRPEVTIRRRPAPGTAPSIYVPDCSLARGDLGLRATVSLDDAIGRTMTAAGERGIDPASP